MFRLALAGGNITGSTVLSLLRGEPDVKIVGLYERNAEAPGALLARKLGIPVFDDIGALAAMEPEIVLNVSGDRKISERIRALYDRTEVIEAAGARLLLKRIEKQKKALIELHRTIEDEKRIIAVIEESGSPSSHTGGIVAFALEKAIEIADFPAGSIAMTGDGEMRPVASKGLSKRFIENTGGKIIPGGLADTIIRNKEPVAISDLFTVNYTNNAALMDEGIRAVLASPILSGSHVFGIIYLDDFKPRQFSERQKRTLVLLSRVLGLIIERQRLLGKMGEQGIEILNISGPFDGNAACGKRDLGKSEKDPDRSGVIKSMFITNMSHELRTPLNSIMGFSDVLLGKTFGELTELQERYVRNIRSSGRYLLDLINNCLDIAKIEAGKYDMVYETLSVPEVLSEVFVTVSPLAERKSLNLDFSIGEDVDTAIADKIKLKQILYNLLSNAIKFTPEGGEIRVLVGREPEAAGSEGDIRFSVKDSGVGIGQGDRERIFDEFEQVDSSLSRSYEGAGLGLALTKKLVELHGGKISVESKKGEGSVFTFVLPQASPPQASLIEEAEPLSLNGEAVRDKAPLILVVEDDLPSAELLTLHLSQAGYKVAHAFDGDEAIEKARTMKPFAILLDIMLPKKDGWEVLQSLKELEATSNIPVLIHSIIDNKDLAFALGATDYLLKPLDTEALLSRLQGLSIARSRRCPLTVLVIEGEGGLAFPEENTDGHELLVRTAREGRRGIELATALLPDVILLDFELPDMLGFEVVKELKEHLSTRNIPIFILTERNISVDDRISLAGKIERIIRKHPFDVEELIDHITEIEILHPRKAGLIDDMTGLFSHRYFQIRLAQEVERAVRYRRPLNLVLLDIDSFGRHIKENGERQGNFVVWKIAEILRKNIRASDIVVRYGGDSFAVLLPDTVLSAALSLGNKFSAIIRNYPFSGDQEQSAGRVTVSVGLTFLDGQTPEELILCCEKAMARAIAKGGDRVEIYSTEVYETGKTP